MTRYLATAAYGAFAIAAPIAGAWLTITIRHARVADADALTFLFVVLLVAYAGVSIVLTPARCHRQAAARAQRRIPANRKATFGKAEA